MTNFYEQYSSIEPYLKQKQPNTSHKENFQSVEDRKKLVCYFCVTLLKTYQIVIQYYFKLQPGPSSQIKMQGLVFICQLL